MCVSLRLLEYACQDRLLADRFLFWVTDVVCGYFSEQKACAAGSVASGASLP